MERFYWIDKVILARQLNDSTEDTSRYSTVTLFIFLWTEIFRFLVIQALRVFTFFPRVQSNRGRSQGSHYRDTAAVSSIGTDVLHDL